MQEDDFVDVEWHEEKRLWTIAVRGIDFDDLRGVFADDRRLETEDVRRDYGESRWRILCPVDGRPMHVTYTLRGQRRRIISARRANAREQRTYDREWANRAGDTS
jgi:uncharacterized DUF497 family protein